MSLSAVERYCSVRVGASAAMPGAAARRMRAIGSRNRMDEDLISHDSRDRLPEVGSQNTRRAGFPLADLHRDDDLNILAAPLLGSLPIDRFHVLRSEERRVGKECRS